MLVWKRDNNGHKLLLHIHKCFLQANATVTAVLVQCVAVNVCCSCSTDNTPPLCLGVVARLNNKKKRAYNEQHIREVEHSSFTPLKWANKAPPSTRGLPKWNESYGSTLSWVQCLLSFCLLRSATNASREFNPPVVTPSSRARQSILSLMRLRSADFICPSSASWFCLHCTPL